MALPGTGANAIHIVCSLSNYGSAKEQGVCSHPKVGLHHQHHTLDEIPVTAFRSPQKQSMFFLPNILCVHLRNLGTSVRKSTTKSDLQNLQNRYQCRRSRQAAHLSFREEIYESEVTGFCRIASLVHACMRSRFEAWASGAVLA